jgi:hypothetical protein
MNADFLGRNFLERMGKKERILGFFDAKEMLQRTIFCFAHHRKLNLIKLVDEILLM